MGASWRKMQAGPDNAYLGKVFKECKTGGVGISACWHGMCHVSATTIRAINIYPLLTTHALFQLPLRPVSLEATWGRLQLKCDGTRWRTGGEVKGKLANGVGSQYPSHYLGTWCIQHYYRRYAHIGCQKSTELTPPPRRFKWTRSVSPKGEIWFLCVCHHISSGLYPRVIRKMSAWFKWQPSA